MPQENIPASSQSDGRWRVTYVPTGSNAKSVAILNGGTAVPLTYSLTADGFNHTINETKVEDKRLTLPTDLSRSGRSTEDLVLKYIESSVVGSADATLTEGLEGQLLVRKGVANADTHATGQKAKLITFQAGRKRDVPPTENGIDAIEQTLYITKPTESVTLVA